jgi:hypothetical protein
MRLLNKAVVMALLVGFGAGMGHAQGKVALPSDSDINLVVLQADAAMDEYRAAAGQEETLMGKAGADAASRDKVLLGAWDYASRGFKSRPQTFNSELGFEIVLVLDDAARNTALCDGAALSAQKNGGDGGRAELAKTCSDASTHLHAASQSVSALYRQYLEAEQAAKACP